MLIPVAERPRAIKSDGAIRFAKARPELMAKPKPPVVAADPPPAFVLPDRQAGPAAPTGDLPPAPAPAASVQAEPAVPAPAAPQADFQLLLILAGVAVALAALAALFALLAWRRGGSVETLGGQVTRLSDDVQRTDRTIREETAAMRREADERNAGLRGELRDQVVSLGTALNTGLEGTRGGVETRMDAFAKAQGDASELLRMAVGKSVTGFGEGLKQDFTIFQGATREQLAVVEQRIAALTEANEARQQALREAVEKQLEALRLANDAKLEQMRATVDEKLQGTLEKRLGESFALVSERLENVQRGLGEMQALALGVGDLKRVLTNVKSRGGWGEMQLGALLSSLLAAEQFAEQVAVTGAQTVWISPSGCPAAKAVCRSGCPSTRSSRSRITSGFWARRNWATSPASKPPAGGSSRRSASRRSRSRRNT